MAFQPDSARKRSHNLHEAYKLPCVQWITPDDGHRRCPKHVEFYDKNTFWILMHLVGYFYEKCKQSPSISQTGKTEGYGRNRRLGSRYDSL